jgi:hypothetical protein
MKKKLPLSQLKVSSFVTDSPASLMGGHTTTDKVPTLPDCPDDFSLIPTRCCITIDPPTMPAERCTRWLVPVLNLSDACTLVSC